MAEAVYDILGNAINAGDVIWQYRGYTQDARIGGVIYASSYGGRSRVKADGSFKRAFAPNSTVNLTALGIPTAPRFRPEEYPDNMREFNRNHVSDAVGVEARAHDKVLFWVNAKQPAIGTVRYFCGDAVSIILDPELSTNVWNSYQARNGQFVIYEGELSIPKSKLYHKKNVPPRPKRNSRQKSQREQLKEAREAITCFSALFQDWKNGQIGTEAFRCTVDELIFANKHNITKTKNEENEPCLKN